MEDVVLEFVETMKFGVHVNTQRSGLVGRARLTGATLLGSFPRQKSTDSEQRERRGELLSSSVNS